MKVYTPMQYLAIDIANHYGLDKQNYENRIQFVKDNLSTLETLTHQAEEPILYAKAVHALRQAMNGEEIGHYVAFDSASSGLQLMSLITNCKSGMQLTGLIDPDNRADAYTTLTKHINDIIAASGEEPIEVSRKDAKSAVMTVFYGSKAVPKRVFGSYVKFFKACMAEHCKGAWSLLEFTQKTWKNQDVQSWIMPDNHTVYLPSMVKQTVRLNVTELGYHPTACFHEIQGYEGGISNTANLIHSIDAYVLRTMVRRCSYNPVKVNSYIKLHLSTPANSDDQIDEHFWINERYKATKIACISFIEHISSDNIRLLSNELREALMSICDDLLNYQPFELVTVHDSFACHPNHVQRMRQAYNQTLLQLYQSTILQDLLSQMCGKDITVTLDEEDYSDYILNSNYGIC